jgi:hypothetical protein
MLNVFYKKRPKYCPLSEITTIYTPGTIKIKSTIKNSPINEWKTSF